MWCRLERKQTKKLGRFLSFFGKQVTIDKDLVTNAMSAVHSTMVRPLLCAR